MKKNLIALIIIASLSNLFAQSILDDYKRAESYLAEGISKVTFKTDVNPNWIKNSSSFWYKLKTRNGTEYKIVDAESGKKRSAFNQKELAKVISEKFDTSSTEYNLEIELKEIKSDLNTIVFKYNSKLWSFEKETKKIEEFVSKKSAKNINVSPDGKWEIVSKEYNLFLVDLTEKDTTQLTFDGVENYDYGYWPSWYAITNTVKEKSEKRTANVTWSSDSKKFYTYRVDRKNVTKLWMLKSAVENSFQAEPYYYERSLAGFDKTINVEYVIFDIEKNKNYKIDKKPFASFLSWDSPKWKDDSKSLNWFYTHRGHNLVEVLSINAETGKCKTLIKETSDTYVDPALFKVHYLKKQNQLLLTSERDDWNHIYRYNLETGELINQVTKGNFVVIEVTDINEEAEEIIFRAVGRDGQDPYLRFYYSVKFDGSKLKLLTPEDAYHYIQLSPDKKYFVDNFSRVDKKPESVLRKINGELVCKLEESDITDLVARGYRFPQTHKVKARDGKTDIYCCMFLPSNFDPAKKYPVIDATYSGPHRIWSPKTFMSAARNHMQPIAELGFIVVTVDGLGTAFRNKKFHEFSYQNLGDNGSPDHIVAIKQLAEKYSFMNISKVGIYGQSAGGYDAARAMFMYPDFYKVGVSASGNHDLRMSKAWWPELWMGYPAGKHYDEQSNLNHAHKLEGKLLLITGDMDNNVNPASTIKLADELMKHGKDFDLMILTNWDHAVWNNKYYYKLRWNYFVEHLLGKTPPRNYVIK